MKKNMFNASHDPNKKHFDITFCENVFRKRYSRYLNSGLRVKRKHLNFFYSYFILKSSLTGF